MGDLKQSKQAVGATLMTELTDFAPPTIAAQAARLQSRQRFFNLVVTNVPGPQFPLYLLGRELEAIFPMVPLAKRQAVCFGIMSYNGQVNFGLIGDYDAIRRPRDARRRPRGLARRARRSGAAREAEPPAGQARAGSGLAGLTRKSWRAPARRGNLLAHCGPAGGVVSGVNSETAAHRGAARKEPC